MITKTKEYKINISETDDNNNANIVSIFKYLQEMAITHSIDCGCGYEEMAKNDIAWVLHKWKVRMYTYPKGGDIIKITTWTCGIKGLYAYRCFRITDSNGSIIGEALTIWLIFKLSTRRLQRIPKHIIDCYPVVEDFVLINDLTEDLLSNVYSEHGLTKYVMQLEDIDENLHVNNLKYIELGLSGTPQNIKKSKLIHDIEVLYKNESYQNDRVNCILYNCSDNVNSFVSIIESDTSDKNIAHAIIRTTWK